ncbi:unnamed protein product [Penicillium olsonii]|uniref:Major facilitator superfamily (MFS) profile domain-containing protein n=1 Tax=Penicillium olsonii TaxID=99116 RepID=A0A9W4MLP7_PENOL|nr:unnamed protein product [Penicillium olsonii]CAG8268048.1 unnamed protein product [Penicillium olsonii]
MSQFSILRFDLVFTLFAGRLIQSLASTSVWVVGYATLADQVPANQIGKMYGLVTVAINVGTSAGPLVAGVLFDTGGYWAAWSSVLILIVFDAAMRCLMIENPPINRPAQNKADEEPEREVLLPTSTENNEELTGAGPEKTGIHFYLCLFTNGRFLGGAFSYMCFAILTASFDATLPLHVRDAFQWGSMSSGLLFAVLQGPGVFLSVPVGWLKDRVGTRHPTTIGFALLVPLMWAIGIPGDERFPWASTELVGPVMYSAAVCSAGVVICLLNGVGMMEATQAVDEIQDNSPGIFGRNGGYSRAISLVSMSWTAGMFIGPILAGYGVEQIGYYGLNCILGMFVPCHNHVSVLT